MSVMAILAMVFLYPLRYRFCRYFKHATGIYPQEYKMRSTEFNDNDNR
jgi:hypothetical protein